MFFTKFQTYFLLTMKELTSLVSLINRNKVKKIEIIGNGENTNANFHKLYLGISNGQFENELEAANYFFPNIENRDIYFNRLKRNLKERLINTLFFIDTNQPNFTDLQKAYYNCYKNVTAVKILLGRYARQHAIPLAEKTLKKAIKFEFTDIVLALAKELRMHYGTITGDKKKYRKLNDIVKKYTIIYEAELKVEAFYSELIVNLVNSIETKAEVINLAKKYSTEIKKIIKKIDSYRVNYIGYLVLVIRFEMSNDFKNTLLTCKEALTYFKSKKDFVSNVTKSNFTFRMLGSYIQLKQYRNAEKTALLNLEYVPLGSANWYYTLIYYMIICFRIKDFQKAYNLYTKAINHPNFENISKNIYEHWRIQEAFVYYFILTQKINPNSEEKVKKFRIAKFLNEVPTHSKDKRGSNITILILHILFLLHQKKYGAIIDRMESLKTYTHRYLRKDDTFRSNCFIKMLLQLPATSFHKEAVLRKADKYWKKLQSVPLEKANQAPEVEVVPYEMLWEYVLESLDNKFH